ncbi:plasmid mobilization relaxosome protein MobC [Planobispora siamensis]|nr:plasmid mobilization relaxosome protein MobC [Planobispora siamensis]
MELAVLTLAAERKGMEVGAYVTEVALAVAQEELTPAPVDRRAQLVEFIQARVTLNRIGNNLNQAARALNGGAEASELAQVLGLVQRTVLRVEEAAATIAGEWNPLRRSAYQKRSRSGGACGRGQVGVRVLGVSSVRPWRRVVTMVLGCCGPVTRRRLVYAVETLAARCGVE